MINLYKFSDTNIDIGQRALEAINWGYVVKVLLCDIMYSPTLSHPQESKTHAPRVHTATNILSIQAPFLLQINATSGRKPILSFLRCAV